MVGSGIQRRLPILGLSLILACSGPEITATGPQVGAGPPPPEPDQVRYTIHMVSADTSFDSERNNVVLELLTTVTTRDGLPVLVAQVDFGATVGSVDPTTTRLGPDRTVTVKWYIPVGTRVASLYGCARPPDQSCNSGPLLKWNS